MSSKLRLPDAESVLSLKGAAEEHYVVTRLHPPDAESVPSLKGAVGEQYVV